MSKSLKSLINNLSETAVTIMEDGMASAEFGSVCDSGSYALNAVCSASLHGGFQDNKITILAGETSTGKTFLALSVAKTFQMQFPDAWVAYFDTEKAVTKDMAKKAGIDPARMALFEPNSIEMFKAQAVKLLKEYEAIDKDERPRMIMILDSLGALPSKRVLEEGDKEDVKSDTGRTAKAIAEMISVLNQHLAPLCVPLLMTNHVYDNVGGYGPAKKMSGGNKIMYLASTVLFMSKKRLGEKGDQQGIVVTVDVNKSRWVRAGKQIETVINFEKGLDRYWGLIDIAIKCGAFEEGARHIILPDGKKVFRSAIEKEPAKYFTPEVMSKIEEFVRHDFALGGEATWFNNPSSNT